jgi:hypothetical protein
LDTRRNPLALLYVPEHKQYYMSSLTVLLMPDGPVPQPAAPKPKSWNKLKNRATTGASIAILFAFLLAVGLAIGYFWAQRNKPASTEKKTVIETLSKEDLQKLNDIGGNLGTSGQTLNIGANALFRGKADVTGDLTIGGRLNANGPVTLSELNIAGETQSSGLRVGSNLTVAGSTTLGREVIIGGATNINNNLIVTGRATIGALNASTISVRSIAVTGPITVAHLATSGPTPFVQAGSIGAGGTVSISGNDTAGTVNINTGSGVSTNVTLATVTFRAPYGATVHVQITPLTSGAATANAYVTRSPSSFVIRAVNPPSSQTLSFDYIVTQ